MGVETDEALLARYAAGDTAAARLLTSRHAGRCFSLARRRLGDVGEAEDVAQDAMLRLWRIAPDWRAGEARVTTWLWRVTINLCTDRLRRRRPGPGLDDIEEPADDRPSAETGLVAGERVAALRAAVAALPDRQRRAIELRHFDELSNIEIAELLDCSVEAVESLLARGRRSLVAALAGQRDSLGLQE